MSKRICFIDGCGRSHYARGWCEKHYKRWRTHDDPERVLLVIRPGPIDGRCTVDQCQRPTHARGWCNKHYMRWLKHGAPDVVEMILGDDEARFWSHVEKAETCWLWTSTITGNGYGHYSIKRVKVGAHRFAYELMVGPIPQGLTIDHLCRVKACVNPDHLEPVTQAENNRRGIEARTIERNSQ